LRSKIIAARGIDAQNSDKDPAFTLDAMLDVRAFINRWLRPTEVKAVFGKDTRIFSRLFKIVEFDGHEIIPDEDVHDNDTVSKNTRDPRISFIIGKEGRVLTDIIRQSGCLHIWIQNHKAVTIYASGKTTIDAEKRIMCAARLMCETWRTYRPGKRDRGGSPFLLTLSSPPGLHTMQVPLKSLYKSISQLSSSSSGV
jgi:hypothetical protein